MNSLEQRAEHLFQEYQTKKGAVEAATFVQQIVAENKGLGVALLDLIAKWDKEQGGGR